MIDLLALESACVVDLLAREPHPQLYVPADPSAEASSLGLSLWRWQLGLLTTRIQHRLSVSLSREENRFCEPVEIRVSGCPVTLAPKKNADLIRIGGDHKGLELGVGQALGNGEVVKEPMDFSQKNCTSLLDLQNLMVKLFFPDVEQSGEPCKCYCKKHWQIIPQLRAVHIIQNQIIQMIIVSCFCLAYVEYDPRILFAFSTK
ncbi:hypothetical protein L7F22_035833 [Adiantum nelumboides]|nr:hypothetical protein [Adiantum nelumboides]